MALIIMMFLVAACTAAETTIPPPTETPVATLPIATISPTSTPEPVPSEIELATDTPPPPTPTATVASSPTPSSLPPPTPTNTVAPSPTPSPLPPPEPPSDAEALKLIYPDEEIGAYKVILSAPFRQEGYEKHLVLTDNVLVDHCPSCPLHVDAALFVLRDGAWQLDDLHQVVAELSTALNNSPTAEVIPFGPEKDGVVFSGGYQGQGHLVSTATYVTDVDGEFKQVLSLTTFESNRLSDACFEQQLCYEHKSTVDFIRGRNPIYDDIRVTDSGTKLVDDQPVEFTEVITYTFSGAAYILADG